MPSALVLVIDGLGAGLLGPYGNTSIETAALNQLAAESILWERCYAASAPNGHLLQHVGALLQTCRERFIATRLITDDAQITGRFAAQFEQSFESPILESHDGLAEHWEQTALAQFFASAIDDLSSHDDGQLSWIQTRGLSLPWDAPLAYRGRFIDEDDPEATDQSVVPHLILPPKFDPDELHLLQSACAGQVVLLDECLALFFEVFAAIADQHEAILIVTSERGFPLGEHQMVGWCGDTLYRELLHVPLLVRLPGDRWATRRSWRLLDNRLVPRLLENWFSKPSETFADELSPQFDRDPDEYSLLRNGAGTLLRTRSWNVMLPPDSEEDDQLQIQQTQLYTQPDDVTEANNVADRARDVAEAAEEFVRQLDRAAPVELPEILR